MTSKTTAPKSNTKAPNKAPAVEKTAATAVIDALRPDFADVTIAADKISRLSDASKEAALSGLTAFSSEYSAFMEKSAQDASALMTALMAVKSLPEAFEVGNKYGLDAVNAYMAHLQRLQEITADSTGKALEPLADSFGGSLTNWWKTAA